LLQPELLRTFLRPPKVPMRASQRPLWPDTPRYRDLPRVKALLLRRTYATMLSCRPALQKLVDGGLDYHRA
jgi:hypothetical protein